MIDTYSWVYDDFLMYRINAEVQIIPLESKKWWNWLNTSNIDEFNYTSRWGVFSAQRTRKGASCCWYAYMRDRQVLSRRYLGHCMDLTIGHLRRNAAILRKNSSSRPPCLFSAGESGELLDVRSLVEPPAPCRVEAQSLACAFSLRETEVIQFVADGLSTSEIAIRMGIGASTVRWYLKNIYLKLHVHNRVQLALWAKEQPSREKEGKHL
jgi:DNA-binding CsgD family transcriptional regulator